MVVTTESARSLPSPDVQRRMYELMALMKTTDDRMVKGIGAGEFITFYYSFRGQEAIAAALGVVLRDTDQLVTTYRGLHDHIGKGVPLDELLSEILGKESSVSGGKGGLMHIVWPERGSMLSTGIVGAGIPVAVGLALAADLDGADRVTAVCFGDGATNTGSFHEAANLAAVWNLPVVLVCQNNLYGEKTPIEMTMKVERIADRAASYGMPGIRVDGNDPDASFGALAEAVDRARSGGGPTLVELVTFRFRGHSYGDDQAYIPKEQFADAETRDPVPTYRARLLASGVCTEDELVAIEEAASATVEETVKAVIGASEAPAETLLAHVYANPEKMPA
jgi:pyruvate dehydrogenase E1 component alpha subunit